MYTGWVPNVSGFLSFSHIGGMPIRNRTGREEIHPPIKFLMDAKHLSLLQERNLSDRPTVGRLTAPSKRGVFTFLLQAQQLKNAATGTRTLAGIIVCAPRTSDAPLRTLHQGVKDNFEPAELSEHVAGAMTALRPLGDAAFVVAFELSEDGITKIKSLANADPGDSGGRLRAFEAYSFLKDILHSHRFHDPGDDALLELTADVDGQPDLWAERVARNLHRSVISSFRSTSTGCQTEGLGKLAYLESFLGICNRRGVKLEITCQVEALRRAIEANHGRSSQSREEKTFIFTFILSAMAIAAPIFFVCIQLLALPCIESLTYEREKCGTIRFVVPPAMLDLTKFTLHNLDWLVVTTVVFFASIVMVINRKPLVAYNADKLGLQSWTTDLRDLMFRLSISNRRLMIVFLCTLLVGVFEAARRTIVLLLP